MLHRNRSPYTLLIKTLYTLHSNKKAKIRYYPFFNLTLWWCCFCVTWVHIWVLSLTFLGIPPTLSSSFSTGMRFLADCVFWYIFGIRWHLLTALIWCAFSHLYIPVHTFQISVQNIEHSHAISLLTEWPRY